MLRRFYKFYKVHFWSFNGSLAGLLIGLSVIFIGFFQTLFIAICVFIGYYIGKQLEKDKNFLRHLLDKILPPGTYR
ncbi:MAG: DUF2273 domain-containing protein [Clostridiales bacterium]|jgi:uncharacterized membrane protein|nr:DUF2273 domain-containing protein [Clostridiales bacterium]